jgi:hypothetical protein
MAQYNVIERDGDAVLTFGARNEVQAIVKAKMILKTLDGWYVERAEKMENW